MSLNTIQRIGDTNAVRTADTLTIPAGATMNLDTFNVQLTSFKYSQEGLFVLVEAVDGAAALTGNIGGLIFYPRTSVKVVDSYRSLGQLVVLVRRTS